MAECIVLKGGGADLDVVSADAGDVTAGKLIVDKDGNPLTGTLPYYNSGTYWNRDLQLGLEADNFYSFFPVGRHAAFDSRGSLHRIPIARLQTAIGATSAKILSGQSIAGVAGGIAQMAGQTINPTASQQIVSTSGKYLTGNVTVKGVTNLTAANIKKGVNVGGTVGNFEGYVPTANDLYLRGNAANITGGFRSGNTYVDIDPGQITVKKTSLDSQSPSGHYYGPCTYNKINLKGYNYVNVEFTVESAVKNINVDVALTNNSDYYMIPTKYLTYARVSTGVVNNKVISLPVAAWQVEAYVFVSVSYNYQETHRVAIYRIWLS